MKNYLIACLMLCLLCACLGLPAVLGQHPPAIILQPREINHHHPIPERLSKEEKQHIVGSQKAVWTEFISSVDHLEYMLLPRLPAFA